MHHLRVSVNLLQVQSVWEQPPGWTKAGEIIKVLYFGDSVDAHQIMDLCKQAESRAVQVTAIVTK